MIGALGFIVALAIAFTSPATAQSADALPPVFAPAARASNVGLAKNFSVSVWQTEQGLPLSAVHALQQDALGDLWVGTAGGVARFDGLTFKTFPHASIPELNRRPIFGFMRAQDGSMWIGHSRGAARHLPDGRFERAIPDESLAGRRVWAFAQARDGVVWAASENGLFRIENGNIKTYTVAQGLPTNRLRSVCFDQAGTLWIGTTGGGLVAMTKEGKFDVYSPDNGFPHYEVRHVVPDSEGGIWATTPGAGLVRWRDGQFKIYTRADGLPSEQLTVIARDEKSNDLWIGTWGEGVIHMRDGRFTTLSSRDGLSGDHIWSLQLDREGSLWVGTWHGGLNRVSQRAFAALGKPEGLANDNVRSVIKRTDGAMVVGVAGGGLHIIKNGKITRLGKVDGLVSDEVSTVAETRDGALWIGTYTDGLSRLKDGKFEKFGLKEGLPSVDVRALLQDRDGVLWVGTNFGFARFDGKRFELVRDLGIVNEGVTSMLQDRTGTIWIGTTGQGLTRYRDGKFFTLTRKDGLVSNWPLSLYEDADGSLWVGSNGEGINRIRGDRIVPITPNDGLWDGNAHVILEDKRHNFWMTTNRGFFRVARADLDAFAEGKSKRVKSVGYGTGHALRTTTFASGLQPAGAIDGDGLLWLPSLQGLVIVDTDHLPDTDIAPDVHIEEVVVDGATQIPKGVLALPSGALPITIRYGAATLKNPQHVRFRHRMQGISDQWIDAERNREVSFPRLPHGEFQFQVAASYDGENWREITQPLAIQVAPRFYETQWFAILAGLGLLGVGGGIYRWRTHQLRAQHIAMETQVEAKTEALRNANQQLSALSFSDPLTGLANRRRLDEVLADEWRRGKRAQTPLALLLIDIDFFKSYNDTLGHQQGDKCLIEIARIIEQFTQRAGDFAARYGGEEFFIVLPNTTLATGMEYGEKLRAACESAAIPHPQSSVSPFVTVSIGVAARMPTEHESVESLIAETDAALYRAKNAQRNQVRS